MVVLTAYMYSKTIKFKQLIWREDFEINGDKEKKDIVKFGKIDVRNKKKNRNL